MTAKTNNNGMLMIVILIVLGGGALVAFSKKKTGPGPGQVTGPPFVFTIQVVNLPAGGTSWGCAFLNPATGLYSHPTNHPTTGSFTFAAGDPADLSVPVSSGTLSISAFAGTGLSNINQLVNYQVPMSITKNSFVWDFSSQSLS